MGSKQGLEQVEGSKMTSAGDEGIHSFLIMAEYSQVLRGAREIPLQLLVA